MFTGESYITSPYLGNIPHILTQLDLNNDAHNVKSPCRKYPYLYEALYESIFLDINYYLCSTLI